MAVDPSDYPVQVNNWLATEILYKGIGKAIFTAPAGFIEGPSQVDVDETGKLRIMLEIGEFDCEEYLDTKFSRYDTLMWLLKGRKPHVTNGISFYAIGVHNTCSSFQIVTPDGTLTAVGQINYKLPTFDREKIVFHAISAVFTVNSEEKPEYWVFPLNNFVSPSLETISFPLQRHIIDKHPLRVFPPPVVPLDLPPEEQQQAISYANRANCFIPFESGQSLGFIERLPDYQERANRLTRGESGPLITAVMVGNVEERATEFNEALRWLPLDHLHLLSLATGNLVGIPWIEFRDKHGDLVCRLHTQQWQVPFASGHIAIDNFSEDGIGWLLTKAPDKLETELRTAIRLIVKGSQSIHYLEDKLAFLFRAADTLTKHLRIQTTTSTPAEIDEQLKIRTKKILREAGHQIRKIAEEGKDSDKVELERISQVVSGAMNKSPKKPDEARALMLLAIELGLMDFAVLPDPNGWMQLYNKYRNQVIHEGYLPSNYPAEEYIPLWFHLQDLLIRVVLKKLGYDGKYRKFIPPRKNRRVDWVQADTSISELWYDTFPR